MPAEQQTTNWVKLWTQLQLDQWLEILNTARPEHHWVIRGNRILGHCVYHQENTPSLHIVPEKNFAHCFGANCRTHESNPIKFLEAVTQKNAYHLLRELKNKYNIKFNAEDVEKLQLQEKRQQIKNVIYKICTNALHDNVNNTQPYAAPAINWLRERKIPLDVIHACPIGILPPRNQLSAYLQLYQQGNLYEDIYRYLEEHFSSTGAPRNEGWVCLFYFDTPTTIGRIKLREPSNKHNFVFIKDNLSEMGMFGLNMFPELRAEFDQHYVYVVEGEFDALTLITQQLVQGRNDMFVVASGGSMIDNLEHLVSYWKFKGIRLLADNDDGGKWRTLDWLRENNCPMWVFDWPKDVHAKDPDEFVRTEPSNLNILTDDTRYLTALEWVKMRAVEALQAKPTAQETLNIIIRWGQGLKNPIERDAYIQYIEQQYKISSSVVTQLLRNVNDETDFILKIEGLLRAHLLFISVDLLPNGNVDIGAWSKKRKQLQHFIRGRGLRASLEAELGPIDDFIDRNIGIPDFIKKVETKKGFVYARNIAAIQQALLPYVETALAKITETLPSSKTFEIVGQGIHFLPTQKDVHEIYVVNGTKFFRGVVTENGVEYTPLEAPIIHDKYLFRTSNNFWSQNILRLEDLKQDDTLDVKTAFQTLHKFIKNHWMFADPEMDTLFLTTYIFYISVAALFKHMIFVDITGPTHSGKSSFMWLLHGGADSRYKLCEPTVLLENYTAAGVRQFMSNNRFCLLLDEFEDLDAGAQTNQKAWAVREILEMVRSAASGAAFVRGTAGGEPIVGKLNFPMIVSGIYTMQQPQDLNRFIHIETVPQPKLASPLLRLQELFTLDEIAHLRRTLTLGLLQRAHEILAVYDDVLKEFHGYVSKLKILDRQLRNFLPIAAILKYVGEDYKNFLIEYSRKKMNYLDTAGATEQMHDRIWDAVFNTPLPIHHFSAGTSLGMMSVINMLADRTHTDLLHSLALGVYYLESRRWAVVVWSQVTTTIFRYTQEFRNYTNRARLRSVADRHRDVIPAEKIDLDQFKEELEPLLKNSLCIQKNNFSVFDLSRYNIRQEQCANLETIDTSKIEVLDV